MESFLTHFDNCATYNRWKQSDRLAYLRSSLSGQAAEVLWTAGAESYNSYEKLLSLLRNRVGSDGQAEKFRAELRTRRRRPGESLRALFYDVRRLITLSYPRPMNSTTEIVARDAFIDALDDRQQCRYEFERKYQQR